MPPPFLTRPHLSFPSLPSFSSARHPFKLTFSIYRRLLGLGGGLRFSAALVQTMWGLWVNVLLDEKRPWLPCFLPHLLHRATGHLGHWLRGVWGWGGGVQGAIKWATSHIAQSLPVLKISCCLEITTIENYSYHRLNVSFHFSHCLCLCVCVCVWRSVYEWVRERGRERVRGVCFIHFSHLVSQPAPVLTFRISAFTLLADLV